MVVYTVATLILSHQKKKKIVYYIINLVHRCSTIYLSGQSCFHEHISTGHSFHYEQL